MSRKPYIELPDILELLPPVGEGYIETEPVDEVGGNSGQLYQSKTQDVSVYTLKSGWYDDSSFSPPRLVLHGEPFEIELDLNDVDFGEEDEIKWEILKDGQVIHSEGGSPEKSFTMSDYIFLMRILNHLKLRDYREVYRETSRQEFHTYMEVQKIIEEISFTSIPVSDGDVDEEPFYTPVYEPLVIKK